MKKNILFVTPSMGYGGAAKMLNFVSESLAERGHCVTVANLKHTNGFERSFSENVHYVCLETTEKRGFKRLEQIKAVKRLARETSADVLVGFNLFPNVIVSVVGRMTGIPSIMSERGDPRFIKEQSRVSSLLLKLVNKCSGGVFQTEGAKEFYGKRLRERGRVIPNPIFVDGELPSVAQSERTKTVVSCGRFDNVQKRYDVMIDAFARFSAEHPEYTLRLFGTGPDEALVRGFVQEKGITDKVSFMGMTTQPMQDIAGDGMFIITSDFEGISNALLEAMAVGLPCVSTDHTPGGARLLITDHENGLLAPIGDAEKLAAAMGEFADDAELAEACGREARKVTERFAPERIIDMWESYITEIADKK